MSMAQETAGAPISDDTAERLARFELEFKGPAPVSDFEGWFHHLRFDWRVHEDEAGFVDPSVLKQVLREDPHKDRRYFIAQMVFAVMHGYEAELLDAAFGRMDQSITS